MFVSSRKKIASILEYSHSASRIIPSRTRKKVVPTQITQQQQNPDEKRVLPDFRRHEWLLNRTVSNPLYRRYGFTRIANNPRKSESSAWPPNDQRSNYIASTASTQDSLLKHPPKIQLRTVILSRYLTSTIHYGYQLPTLNWLLQPSDLHVRLIASALNCRLLTDYSNYQQPSIFASIVLRLLIRWASLSLGNVWFHMTFNLTLFKCLLLNIILCLRSATIINKSPL